MKTYNITKISITGVVTLVALTQICSATWLPRKIYWSPNNGSQTRNIGLVTYKVGTRTSHIGAGNVTKHRKTVFTAARNVYSKNLRSYVATRHVRFHPQWNRRNRPGYTAGRAVRGYFRFVGYARYINSSKRFAYSGAVLYGYSNFRNTFSGWRWNDGRDLRSTKTKTLTGYPKGYTGNYYLNHYPQSKRRAVRSWRNHHKFYGTRVGDGIIGAPFWVPHSSNAYWVVGGIVTSKDTSGSSINVGVMALSKAYINMAIKAANRT